MEFRLKGFSGHLLKGLGLLLVGFRAVLRCSGLLGAGI